MKKLNIETEVYDSNMSNKSQIPINFMLVLILTLRILHKAYNTTKAMPIYPLMQGHIR